MNSKASLALCIWKTRTQLPNKQLYTVLTFNQERQFELYVPKLNNAVIDAKEAVFKLFGFNDPLRLSGEIPKPSFIKWLKDINPLNFLNPNYVSSYAILPKNLNEVICCSEITPDQFKIGIIYDNHHALTFVMGIDEEKMNHFMKFLGTVCVQFICYGSVQEELKKNLNILLSNCIEDFSINGKNIEFSSN